MLRPMVAMLKLLSRAALPALATTLIAGAAAAHDYIVVASTEPAIARGVAVDGGQKLAVTPGRQVTLMHASGEVLVLKGAAGGVTAPKRTAGDADSARLEMFRTMIAPKPRDVSEGLGARRTRAGVCPDAGALTTLDAVAQAQMAGCAEPASQALEAWIAGHTPAG